MLTATEPSTFTHRFGGWHSAEAKHHTNPDGSQGGIVALTASVPADLTLPASVEVGPHALVGVGAKIGAGAKIGYRAEVGEWAQIGDRASVGDRAYVGDRAKIGAGADIGDEAKIGGRASIGDGARIDFRANISDFAVVGLNDWVFILGPQGSRRAWATAVQSERGLLWWFGCDIGIDSETLKARITDEHAGHGYEADYLHAVRFVEEHPGRLRWIADRAPVSTEEAA